MRTIIVSASDDNFLPLAKGLWASLRDRGLDGSFDLFWIDIGNGQQTRKWLEREVPEVTCIELTNEVKEFADSLTHLHYQRALLLRPFLPTLLPHCDTIVWIDSDIWIQDRSTLDAFVEAVAWRPTQMAICPVLDVAYAPLFSSSTRFVEDNVTPVWTALFGADVANAFRDRPLLSAGMFALAADSDLWDLWANQIQSTYERNFDGDGSYIHVAEQTALTYLLYSSGRFTPLEAIHNFHANIGDLERDDFDRVCTAAPVRRVIGAVHLSDVVNRNLGATYVAKGLLYQRGESLSQTELAAIETMGRSMTA